MERHTRAYVRLDLQFRAAEELSLILSHAVPALISQLERAGGNPGTPVKILSGLRREGGQLLGLARDYRTKFARYAILNMFAAFEAYVVDVLHEVIDYHGDAAEFIRRAHTRATRFLISPPPEVVVNKRRLQGERDPTKTDAYRAHTARLLAQHFRFPSELFAPYGVRRLIEDVRGLRPGKIPGVLKDGLSMTLLQSTVQRFHAIRELRNKIAHGGQARPSLREANKVRTDLRKLALYVDRHVVEHFLIIEDYA